MSDALKAESRCMRCDEWPEVDRTAWTKAQCPVDLLDPTIGFASRWRPTTRGMIENGYGRWLGWLERSGQLEPASTPADRASRPRVSAYLQALRDAGLAPYSVAARLQQLGNALRAIAPGHDWTWVVRGSSRLQARATPVRDRTASMRPANEVRALGLDMMQAAENDRFRTQVGRATLFRDGLMIGLLAGCSLRRSNLASIAIGRQLQQRGDRWWLVFEEAEMKGDKRFECPWPDELSRALERYIDVHRNALLGCSRKALGPTSALWISQHGTVMTASAIALQITTRTGEEFGTPINPHTFRSIVATTSATNDPTHATDIPLMLGHSTMKTSEKYYNRAEMLDAGQRYHSTLDLIRERPLAEPRGSKV